MVSVANEANSGGPGGGGYNERLARLEAQIPNLMSRDNLLTDGLRILTSEMSKIRHTMMTAAGTVMLTIVGGIASGFILADNKLESFEARLDASVDEKFEMVDARFEMLNQRMETMTTQINLLISMAEAESKPSASESEQGTQAAASVNLQPEQKEYDD